MASSRWHKGRFFHSLLTLETSPGNQGDVSNDHQDASPTVRLSEIARLNDMGVRILEDGRVGLALHIFSEALQRVQKFSAVDANAVNSRNLTFSEILVTPPTTTAGPANGDNQYLVPVNCADESSIFSKAILLGTSDLQASVRSLLDVLQFHLGLCRHIQGWESSSLPRRFALLDLATKRYKKVHGKGLVRAAAYCNLVSCGGVSFLQGFLDAYHALENPDEISEFSNCITRAAQAA